MPALNNAITKVQVGILIFWISFTITAFGYFIKDRLVNFDVNDKLENIDYTAMSNYLAPYIGQNNNEKKYTVLHFSTTNCTCQKYSQAHVEDINKLAIANNFNIKNIVINEDDVIPATPSIALIDGLGDVIYYGPYGQGLACSQTSGYAQTMLNNYLKGYSANIIVKEAKGCYCEI